MNNLLARSSSSTRSATLGRGSGVSKFVALNLVGFGLVQHSDLLGDSFLARGGSGRRARCLGRHDESDGALSFAAILGQVLFKGLRGRLVVSGCGWILSNLVGIISLKLRAYARHSRGFQGRFPLFEFQT